MNPTELNWCRKGVKIVRSQGKIERRHQQCEDVYKQITPKNGSKFGMVVATKGEIEPQSHGIEYPPSSRAEWL